MASIKISDLRPAGYDLLSDSESYMTDLSEDELGLQGGITPTTTSSWWCIRISIAVTLILIPAVAE